MSYPFLSVQSQSKARAKTLAERLQERDTGAICWESRSRVSWAAACTEAYGTNRPEPFPKDIWLSGDTFVVNTRSIPVVGASWPPFLGDTS